LLKRDTDADVKGIDGVAMDLTRKELVNVVKKHNPDRVLIETPTISFPYDVELAREIKE
jgi:hypothetical protein